MTIEKYIKDNKSWDINLEFELDFVNPEDEDEAKINLLYVLDKYKNESPEVTLNMLAIVVRSYYGSTITWNF